MNYNWLHVGQVHSCSAQPNSNRPAAAQLSNVSFLRTRAEPPARDPVETWQCMIIRQIEDAAAKTARCLRHASFATAYGKQLSADRSAADLQCQ